MSEPGGHSLVAFALVLWVCDLILLVGEGRQNLQGVDCK